VGVFLAEEAEVEGEESVVGLLDEEVEEAAGLFVRPLDGIKVCLEECLKIGFTDELVALGGDLLLSFWEHVCDI